MVKLSKLLFKRRVRKHRRPKGEIWNCPHKDEKYYAKGMCRKCYNTVRYHFFIKRQIKATKKQILKTKPRGYHKKNEKIREFALKHKYYPIQKIVKMIAEEFDTSISYSTINRWVMPHRRETERGRPIKHNYNCPHKDRKHCAKGMCGSCWFGVKYAFNVDGFRDRLKKLQSRPEYKEQRRQLQLKYRRENPQRWTLYQARSAYKRMDNRHRRKFLEEFGLKEADV